MLGILAVACLGLFAATPVKSSAVPNGRVVFENEQTRVIEYRTNGGRDACGTGMHSHPAHLYIMLNDAKLRTVLPDGKEEFTNAKAGEVGWEAAGTHRCESVAGNHVGLFVIEIKDKDWKPSTGI